MSDILISDFKTYEPMEIVDYIDYLYNSDNNFVFSRKMSSEKMTLIVYFCQRIYLGVYGRPIYTEKTELNRVRIIIKSISENYTPETKEGIKLAPYCGNLDKELKEVIKNIYEQFISYNEHYIIELICHDKSFKEAKDESIDFFPGIISYNQLREDCRELLEENEDEDDIQAMFESLLYRTDVYLHDLDKKHKEEREKKIESWKIEKLRKDKQKEFWQIFGVTSSLIGSLVYFVYLVL